MQERWTIFGSACPLRPWLVLHPLLPTGSFLPTVTPFSSAWHSGCSTSGPLYTFFSHPSFTIQPCPRRLVTLDRAAGGSMRFLKSKWTSGVLTLFGTPMLHGPWLVMPEQHPGSCSHSSHPAQIGSILAHQTGYKTRENNPGQCACCYSEKTRYNTLHSIPGIRIRPVPSRGSQAQQNE